MRKRQLSLILSIILVAAMLFTACGSKDETVDNGNASKVEAGKFVPPITLTTFRFVGPQVKYAEGESLENNVWSKAYESRLGIKLKYDFIVPDFSTFDTKVMASMASNSLPDIIPVYTTLFFRIAGAGKLQDLTSVFDKYAEPHVKDNLDRFGGIARKTCTINGKLVALAQPKEPGDSAEMLWIRTDWLDKLKLEAPKNMDDVMNIAKAFATKDPDGNGEDDTFGLAIDKNLGGLKGFANSFHAYKDIWVEQPDGKLGRGDIQPEWKTVLTKLNELANIQAIDPEYIQKDKEELKKDFAAGRHGMVYGPTSEPDSALHLNVEANPAARWDKYLLVSNDDKPALSQSNTRVSEFIGVNKSCTYPEALILIANDWAKLMHAEGKEFREYHDFVDKAGNLIYSFWYPIFSFGGPEFYNGICQEKVSAALESGDTSKLNGEQLGYYERIRPWLDETDPKAKAKGYRMWAIFGPEGSYTTQREMIEKKLYYGDRGWGPETEGWKTYGPELFNSSNLYFSRMILSDLDIATGWDEWVKFFLDNGGQQATDEINAWWEKEGKAGFGTNN